MRLFEKKRNLEEFYYKHGFSGDAYLFQEYLGKLKETLWVRDITVLIDYGENGLEVSETTIYEARELITLKQNVAQMNHSLLGFSKKSFSSITAKFGQHVILREGVKDMGVYYHSFDDGIYPCLIIVESVRILNTTPVASENLQAIRSFVHQKQLADFHSVGYSYNGYMGIPSRDELKKHLRQYISENRMLLLVGVRVINVEELAQKHYTASGIFQKMAEYFLPFYKGGVYAMSENIVGIIIQGTDYSQCTDEFEQHIYQLGKYMPELSLSVCISTIASSYLDVLYEVECALEECDVERFSILRVHKGIKLTRESSAEDVVRDASGDTAEDGVVQEEDDSAEEIEQFPYSDDILFEPTDDYDNEEKPF